MSDGETERTIRFILDQQAQFASDIMQIKDVQEQFAEVQAQSVKDIQQLREAEITIMRGITTVLGLVGQLAEAQKNTDAKLAELAGAQKQLVERVDAFIAAMRNGKKNRP